MNDSSNTDEKYMRRALALARRGFTHTTPNPMVGCVIVSPDGRIIGEGWHRHYGEGHAEVNAVNSVLTEDRYLLDKSTLYVTLEPCSHYGKTPPCAELIRSLNIPRVVVAATDPFVKVCGRGIKMLEDAGIRVDTGLLADESRQLNAIFNTAHTERRPWVTLKWACSADGFMDAARSETDGSPTRFSTPLTTLYTQRLRAAHDGIIVGSGTILADRPRLNVRLWPATSPQPIILDRRHRLTDKDISTADKPLILSDYADITSLLTDLYSRGFTSVLVEGGSTVLNAFIKNGIYDLVRIETAPFDLHDGVRAPDTNALPPFIHQTQAGSNSIVFYSRNPLLTPDHPLVAP